ncbi:helix-turn-helix domain-containing protein [Streptomyces sp. AP-93]|uniref:helix-turn-helix domain-containing protein n=1 Tax=Streptomyces sp. AP-93 TaxID=2929048 RepID=UPI001FB031EE|nr:helix-turn-helix domain-containing protein [Streptomyces sp. AP-93]MCJ0875086.1 helix-turn-helix domain-containing protein [Streptomyces sp. AP-93]
MDEPQNTRLLDLPLHRLEVPLPHLLPFAIGTFDTIGTLSRAAFPHRHTFYEIVYVTGGRGAHVLDLVHKSVEPPELCVVTPGQVHRWADAEGLVGHVVLFNEDFLLSHPQDAAALRTLATRPGHAPGDQAGPIAALLAEMGREYRELQAGYPGVLRASLHILILRALRACAPGRAVAARGRAAELAADFTRLIGLPGGTRRSVGSYAQELGLSQGHLQTLVRHATGRTPGELIRQQQTLEAKRLLRGTQLTVRQVAVEVGIGDPAYFSRFFRRETGMAPGAFRTATGGNHHDPRIESIDVAPEGP